MPVHATDSNEVMTQLFRRNFLAAGGLQLVVNVFKRTSLPQDVDIEVRQACYAIAISLARCVSLCVWGGRGWERAYTVSCIGVNF